MHKCYVVGVLLSLASAGSYAAFTGATYGNPGDIQESFAHLGAYGRSDSDDHTLKPLLIPFVGNMTASFAPVGDTTVSYARQSLTLGSDRLTLDITDFNFIGKAAVGSDGQWLFTVSKPTATVVFGALHVASASANQITVNSTLADLTGGKMLYESYQFDTAVNGDYVIGEVANPLYGKFVGSLSNTLLPARIYRLTYAFSVGGPDAGSGPSNSTGQLVLATVVPEPATLALFSTGLLGLAASRRRRPAVTVG